MKKPVKVVTDIVKATLQISSLNDAHSMAASAVRGPRGLIVISSNRNNPPRPDKILEVYEFEGCPFCRKVREAMTELDLSYINRSCAKGAVTKRRRLEERAGKQQFPYLIDPNTDVEMYESEDIITYLAETYGPGRSRLAGLLAPANTAGAVAASIVRGSSEKVRLGLEDREQPEEIPVLYNLEMSPYCRKVREKFNELNLDYRVENVGKFSARRPELVERGGKMMVPFLIDPNTGVEMYESDDIVAYLEETYGA